MFARFAALTPWKGGGFGMFSTTDAGSTRAVRVFLEADGRHIRARIPARFSSLMLTIKAAPAGSQLGRLADSLVALEWTADGVERRTGRASIPSASNASPARPVIRVTAVSVEVWKYRFDTAGPRLVGFRHSFVRRLSDGRSD
jgi:hypothetical protein